MKSAVVTILLMLAFASALHFPMWRKIAQIVHSKLKIPSTPSAASDVAQVVKGNTDFAFDLFKTIDEKQGNIIFSPYSISVALAMTFAGSHGVTKSQMKNTLHFENEHTHAVFRDLNSKVFQSREGCELKMGNSLWSDKDRKFNLDYIDLVKNLYQGEVRSVDFKGQPEVARQTINDWTSAQTNDKIQNILASKLPDNTKLILVNAIYFKASWAEAFVPAGNSDFTTLNGKTTTADMMKVKQYVNYFQGSGFKSVSLPYKDLKTFMTVILPDAGQFRQVKKNLNTATLSQIFSNEARKSIEVTMPKFKIESELKLKDNLMKLGMENPFTSSADFSRMDGTQNLRILNVIHKAFIEVNENGTEAAAATAVIVGLESVFRPPTQFIVDRPFIYVIHDENHSVLFMGQVDRPLT